MIAPMPPRTLMKCRETIQIARPASAVYTFLRCLENLPRFISHVTSVLPIFAESDRTVVTVLHPLGTDRCWELEILEDLPARRLCWLAGRSDSSFAQGSLELYERGEDAAELRVSLSYTPAVERIRQRLYFMFWRLLIHRQVRADLQRLKRILEGPAEPTSLLSEPQTTEESQFILEEAHERLVAVGLTDDVAPVACRF